MAQRVYWWQVPDPTGGCPPVVVAVLTTGLGAAASLVRRAGFHGVKTRSELGPAPDWMIGVPTAHPGRVCWCPLDCTALSPWRNERRARPTWRGECAARSTSARAVPCPVLP